ncbi:DUF2513 domain-containing protein [Paenibacillus sp. J5C_2022]|uniref:DUF2513 domain-containing protein n=1 Tax=Paenibacillus sp. J5C2022 TaxID=2977129 RepID=UPI0021D02E22|nr:DUF2513 domain-containing protein [Paenibacillus sp. J5C2022]MCU6709417.1 DUF2513 domain-containing protein [Paenibacillus sp. J5C2022]
MKRDMELIIKLLKIIENRTSEEPASVIRLDGYDNSLVQYNLGLMYEYGLIDAIDMSTLDTSGEIKEILPLRLEWKGHDFLDAARSENVVNRAKVIASKQGIELFKMPIEIIKSVLVKAATELLI